eukprot:513933-Pyramimonas_sp.AAC.1
MAVVRRNLPSLPSLHTVGQMHPDVLRARGEEVDRHALVGHKGCARVHVPADTPQRERDGGDGPASLCPRRAPHNPLRDFGPGPVEPRQGGALLPDPAGVSAHNVAGGAIDGVVLPSLLRGKVHRDARSTRPSPRQPASLSPQHLQRVVGESRHASPVRRTRHEARLPQAGGAPAHCTSEGCQLAAPLLELPHPLHRLEPRDSSPAQIVPQVAGPPHLCQLAGRRVTGTLTSRCVRRDQVARLGRLHNNASLLGALSEPGGGRPEHSELREPPASPLQGDVINEGPRGDTCISYLLEQPEH